MLTLLFSRFGIYVDLDFIYYGCDACRNTFCNGFIVVLIPLGINESFNDASAFY